MALVRQDARARRPARPETCGPLSARGALYRLDSSLGQEDNGLVGNVGRSQPLTGGPFQDSSFLPPRFPARVTSERRRGANECVMYPDKQIDGQSSPTHYRSEELTNSEGSREAEEGKETI